MDFAYSPEQEELRKLAKDIFASAEDPGRLRAIESEPEWFDRELWRRLADSNLLGVTVPDSYGGLGLGFLEAALVVEQAGRTLAHGPVIPTVVGGAMALARFGPEDLRTELLPGTVNGETVLTMGLTGRGGGSPLVARRTNDGWVLDGERSFVPFAHVADAAVLSAASSEGDGLFLVRLESPEVASEVQPTMSGDPQFLLRCTGTPAHALVEPGPAGNAGVHWLRQRCQVAYCALELGIADAALGMTARYTTGRVQFERPIATFQAVAHRLADSYIDVLAMRWTMLEAAAALDGDLPADEAVSTAKWWACEGGHRVVSAAQHCHGGVGVDMSYPLYRYFLWSKEVEVTLGSAREQLAELGRQIARGPSETGTVSS